MAFFFTLCQNNFFFFFKLLLLPKQSELFWYWLERHWQTRDGSRFPEQVKQEEPSWQEVQNSGQGRQLAC